MRFERKMSQYKSRVETELQDASGRESEMKLELATKTQDRLRSQISNHAILMGLLANFRDSLGGNQFGGVHVTDPGV